MTDYDMGAERYWELRWRDANKRIEALEAALREIAENKTGDPWDGIAIAYDTLNFARDALAPEQDK